MSDFDPRGLLQAGAMGGIGRAFESLDFEGARLAGAWLGLFAFGVLGSRREIGIGNIRLALGVSNARANQILRRSCVNFGMTFAEFMRQRVATPEEIRRQVSIDHLERIQAGFEARRGVILLTAHVGNWELMGARAAQEFRMAVVARPMNNKRTQKFIDAPRSNHGLEVISKHGDGRAPLKILRENAALAILPDQYAGESGALLPMFGQPTRVYTSLARLAMVSGALVVPSFGLRQKPFLSRGKIVATIAQGWKVEKTADKEAAVLEGTRRMIWELENVVRAHPEQWLWLHRRWRKNDGALI